VRCVQGPNAVKVWLEPAGMVKETKSWPWWSPYVDLFTFRTDSRWIYEVLPGTKRELSHSLSVTNYSLSSYFPTRPYYFGGALFLGPRETIASSRYSLDRCRMGEYSHRVERLWARRGVEIDCCRMARRLPFVSGGEAVSNGRTTKSIYPARAATYDVRWEISPKQRRAWAAANESEGPALTAQVAHLDTAEVDNTIAPPGSCHANHHGRLKVAEFNAARGRHWLHAAPLLQDADVIILNEMDVGMARSDQQHTTRLLAHLLHMNYAWGLEFVELTSGTRQEQAATGHLPNFRGLHGNAFLTRCHISEPVIFRDPVGKYFSDDRIPLNAYGYEKRLGGRMGLFGRIQLDGMELVIGSTHKLYGASESLHLTEYV